MKLNYDEMKVNTVFTRRKLHVHEFLAVGFVLQISGLIYALNEIKFVNLPVLS